MRRIVVLAAPLSLLALPAAAQTMVDVPIWGNGILGQQNLRNTYENADRASGVKSSRNKASSASCSADALPAADRRRMEAEYVRRARADGKASADAWVREQGIRFHQKLVADGVCAASGKADRSAAVGGERKKREVRDKNGRVCTKTRLENRPIANVGGGGMTLGLVPVCAD